MKKVFKFLSVLICSIITALFFAPVKTTLVLAETQSVSSGNEVKKVVNPVVFVRFKGGEEFCTPSFLTTLNKTYNTSPVSMRNFFLKESLGKYDVTAQLLSVNSVELDDTMEYYLPRFSDYDASFKGYGEINPEGYDNRYYLNGEPVAPTVRGALQHADRFIREQKLLREIAEKTGVSSTDGLDGDGDGAFDSFSVIADCDYSSETTWDSILWPHMSNVAVVDKNSFEGVLYLPSDCESELEGLKEKAYVNGLSIHNYNLLTKGYISKESVEYNGETLFNVGVLCHEYLHTLGIYDYYSYVDSNYESVGELDVISSSQSIPQMSLAYLRQKLGWIEEGVNIMPMEKSGSYSLSAVTEDDEVKAYKLVLNDYSETGEYFILEMRSNASGGFDGGLSESGLIIYRVNENNGYRAADGTIGNTCYGNMYGGEGYDEVYVFRHGSGNKVVYNGVSTAILNGEEITVGQVYDKSLIGATDLSLAKNYLYEERGGFLFKKKIYNTTIHYSDGSNSGIEIRNVALSEDKKSVTFDVKFDDASFPVSGGATFEVERDYGGKRWLFWDTKARSGSATVLAVELDDTLVSIENNVVTPLILPTEQQMISGQMEGYKTVIHKKTPISFKKTKLVDEGKGYAVYVMFDDGQNRSVNFVGAVYDTIGTDSAFRMTAELKFLLIAGAVAVVLAVVLLSLIFSVIKKRKRSAK